MSKGSVAVCPVTGASRGTAPSAAGGGGGCPMMGASTNNLHAHTHPTTTNTTNGTSTPAGRSRSGSISSISSSHSTNSVHSTHSSSSSLALSDLGSIGGDEFATNMLDLLTQETRDVIKTTWAMAISKRDNHDTTPVATFVGLFFSKLFELSPESQLVFNHDIGLEGRTLSNVLTGMLEYLIHPKKLKKQVKALAKSHVALGITPEMFQAFGDALIHAIHVRLGEDWNASYEKAWIDAYSGISGLIVRAMQDIEIVASDIPAWMVERYRQHHIVMERTWSQATEVDDGDKLLSTFFKRLQANSPVAFHVYEKADARQRKVIVWSAVTKILDALNKPRSLKKELKPIATSHAKMGVDGFMLESFGISLREALKEVLGDVYTVEVDVVWNRCFRLLSLTLTVAISNQAGKGFSLHSKGLKAKDAKDCTIQ